MILNSSNITAVTPVMSDVLCCVEMEPLIVSDDQVQELMFVISAIFKPKNKALAPSEAKISEGKYSTSAKNGEVIPGSCYTLDFSRPLEHVPTCSYFTNLMRNRVGIEL